MYGVAKARSAGLELHQRRLGPPLVARDEHDARAHPRERQNRGFADAGCRAGRDHGLAPHDSAPCAEAVDARRLTLTEASGPKKGRTPT